MKTSKLTLKQSIEIKNLIDTEINEVEYIDHIVIENDTTFFNVIHLNGSERLINVFDIIK